MGVVPENRRIEIRTLHQAVEAGREFVPVKHREGQHTIEPGLSWALPLFTGLATSLFGGLSWLYREQ